MKTMRQIIESISGITPGNMEVIKAFGKKRGDWVSLMAKGDSGDLEEWRDVMLAAIPNGYNEFDVETVYNFFANLEDIDEFEFIPARESSICLYINGPIDELKELGKLIKRHREKLCDVDEVWVTKEGQLRLWWD